MKSLPWVLLGITILIVIILYVMNKNSSLLAASLINKNPNSNSNSQTSNPYALGLSLAQLIGNTKCGKDGNPPCTIQDLQAAGWSPEQIATAQEATQNVSSFFLCADYGIGC